MGEERTVKSLGLKVYEDQSGRSRAGGRRAQGLNALLCPSGKARGAPGGLLPGSTEG